MNDGASAFYAYLDTHRLLPSERGSRQYSIINLIVITCKQIWYVSARRHTLK